MLAFFKNKARGIKGCLRFGFPLIVTGLQLQIFGRVVSLKRETPPDSLVMHILQPKHFSTLATQYGIDNEQLALEKYVSHQNTHGHPDLTVSASQRRSLVLYFVPYKVQISCIGIKIVQSRL